MASHGSGSAATSRRHCSCHSRRGAGTRRPSRRSRRASSRSSSASTHTSTAARARSPAAAGDRRRDGRTAARGTCAARFRRHAGAVGDAARAAGRIRAQPACCRRATTTCWWTSSRIRAGFCGGWSSVDRRLGRRRRDRRRADLDLRRGRSQVDYRFRHAEVTLLDEAARKIGALRGRRMRQAITASFRAVPELLAF